MSLGGVKGPKELKFGKKVKAGSDDRLIGT